jgi:hypothetical protein
VSARNSVTLSPVGNWTQEVAAVETAIRQPDCVLLLFVNASTLPGLAMHSVVVGYEGGLFYFDTCPGALRPGLQRLTDFGTLGDAYIVRKRP